MGEKFLITAANQGTQCWYNNIVAEDWGNQWLPGNHRNASSSTQGPGCLIHSAFHYLSRHLSSQLFTILLPRRSDYDSLVELGACIGVKIRERDAQQNQASHSSKVCRHLVCSYVTHSNSWIEECWVNVCASVNLSFVTGTVIVHWCMTNQIDWVGHVTEGDIDVRTDFSMLHVPY